MTESTEPKAYVLPRSKGIRMVSLISHPALDRLHLTTVAILVVSYVTFVALGNVISAAITSFYLSTLRGHGNLSIRSFTSSS